MLTGVGGAVDDSALEDRAAYFRGVAETLRGIATELRYDPRRRDQLLALADGFERFARRLEQEVGADA
jgi:hypothetical protein